MWLDAKGNLWYPVERGDTLSQLHRHRIGRQVQRCRLGANQVCASESLGGPRGLRNPGPLPPLHGTRTSGTIHASGVVRTEGACPRWGAKATARGVGPEWGSQSERFRVDCPGWGPRVQVRGGRSRVQASGGDPGARSPVAGPGWPAGARGNKAAGGRRRTWARSWGWSRPPPRWRTGSWAPAC